MTTDLENFEAWNAGVLEILYPSRDAGFAIMKIVLPLLERYMRQKLGIAATKPLSPAFHQQIFNAIPGFVDVQQATKWWASCRNGLLHQDTLNPHVDFALTHDMDKIVEMRPSGQLELHPVLFAKRVVEIIRNDFGTYVGQTNIGPALPQVTQQPWGLGTNVERHVSSVTQISSSTTWNPPGSGTA